MKSDRFEVLDRLAPLLDAPEPSIEGFLRRRDRRRRNQRIAAGVVGIALFVVPVALIAVLSSRDRTQTPAGPGPTVSPASTRVGFIGLPPEGATPSTPESGELVFSLWGSTDTIPRSRVWVYADGRLIWWREADLPYGANARSTGFLEQRLTSEGVELLRSEIISSGRFGRDLDLADRRIIDAQRDSHLGLLVARLLDPASWLPASAWRDQEIRAYVPTAFAICFDAGPEPIGVGRLLDLLPRPAADLLRTKHRTIEFGVHCYEVTTEEARALADVFDEAGYRDTDPNPALYVLAYSVSAPDPINDEIPFSFQPVLPHGKVTCTPCG